MSRFLKSKRILSIFLVLIIVFSFSSSAIEQKGVVPPPALPITINPFYSTYSSTSNIYNNSYSYSAAGAKIFDDDGLQLRSNCYGYAIRMFYELTGFSDEQVVGEYLAQTILTPQGIIMDYEPIYAYMQRPGEFADKTNGLPLYNLSNQQTTILYGRKDLDDFLKALLYTTTTALFESTISTKFNYIEQLVEADFAELGYTITEYTGTTIPSASSVSGKRMIALVVGETDFHFYMQHSDNTWSHKLGYGPTSNVCIDCENNALTNNNIRSHALEGSYSGGVLKFYYITKNAIIDSSHLRGTYSYNNGNSDCKKTTVHPIEAGNFLYDACELNNTPLSKRYNMDYTGDSDSFHFCVPNNNGGAYTFSFQTEYTPLSLTIEVYDNTGYPLKTQTLSNGSCSFTYALTAGSSYFLIVKENVSAYAPDHVRNRTYTFSITK